MSDAAIKNAVNDSGIFMQNIEERLKYINRHIEKITQYTSLTEAEIHELVKKINRHQIITPLGTVQPYSLSGDFF